MESKLYKKSAEREGIKRVSCSVKALTLAHTRLWHSHSGLHSHAGLHTHSWLWHTGLATHEGILKDKY